MKRKTRKTSPESRLSKRAKRVLVHLRIQKIDELAAFASSDILNIYNCGKMTLDECRRALRRRGKSFTNEKYLLKAASPDISKALHLSHDSLKFLKRHKIWSMEQLISFKRGELYQLAGCKVRIYREIREGLLKMGKDFQKIDRHSSRSRSKYY